MAKKTLKYVLHTWNCYDSLFRTAPISLFVSAPLINFALAHCRS
jgi:hypothetical protein